MATFAKEVATKGLSAFRAAGLQELGTLGRRTLTSTPHLLAAGKDTRKHLTTFNSTGVTTGSGATPFIPDQPFQPVRVVTPKFVALRDLTSAAKQTQEMCKTAKAVMDAERDKLTPAKRREVLTRTVAALRENKEAIMAANQKDVAAYTKRLAEKGGHDNTDRLLLNDARFEGMCADILANCEAAPAPHTWVRNGMQFTKHKPLDISSQDPSISEFLQSLQNPIKPVAAAYELRPTVTSDISSTILTASRSVVLKGSSSAKATNDAILACFHKALHESGMSPEWVQLAPDGRSDVIQALTETEDLAFTVLRGGRGLVGAVDMSALITPTIVTGEGNCSTVISDKCGDLDNAARIALNAKLRRFVCNSMESLILHPAIAKPILERILPYLVHNGKPVTLYAEGEAKELIESLGYPCISTSELGPNAHSIEFEGPSMRVYLATPSQAIAHIEQYGTHHTESIVTEDDSEWEAFKSINAGLLVRNGCTTHTDGSHIYGVPEVGIKTSMIVAGLGEISHNIPLGVITAATLMPSDKVYQGLVAEPARGKDGQRFHGMRGDKFSGITFPKQEDPSTSES